MHFQILAWNKMEFMARHDHLSHIYFYFPPFIISSLVVAMPYSSIHVSVVLPTCNKNTSLWNFFYSRLYDIRPQWGNSRKWHTQYCIKLKYSTDFRRERSVGKKAVFGQNSPQIAGNFEPRIRWSYSTAGSAKFLAVTSGVKIQS